MDPRLLELYERELGHLREMGQEFARQYPKIAGRLTMDGLQVTDPYVERLLEGYAFMAARVQLRLDAEFPRFTDRLLEICYPGFLAPVPSMAIARLQPNPVDPALADGPEVPRHTELRGLLGKGEETQCRFRTAHPVRLWPVEVREVQYVTHVSDVGLPPQLSGSRARAGVRVKLGALGAVGLHQLKLGQLDLHFGGQPGVAFRLHERLMGHTMAVLVRPAGRAWQAWIDPQQLQPLGFEADESLLPAEARSFEGYRLLQEYFALPERFLFARLQGLDEAIAGRATQEVELLFLLDQGDTQLEGVLDASSIALHCTPVVNLFSHRCDRIMVREGLHEFHVVPDLAHPMDYEVFEVQYVYGHGAGSDNEREFLPLYASFHTEGSGQQAYYCQQREPRVLSDRQRKLGPRSSYVGSEVYLSLVDPREAPLAEGLRQLSVKALCTNRDLPLHLATGLGKTDFVLEVTAPVDSVRMLAGPSKPSQRGREASQVWQLVNHLNLNHLSLSDTDSEQGAAALRTLLGLYAQSQDAGAQRQIEGIRHVRVTPKVKRLPEAERATERGKTGRDGGATHNRITYGRTLEVEVEIDESAFQGGSAYLLGLVLGRFFRRHASINTAVQTVLISTSRGELMRDRLRWGRGAVL